MSNFRITPNKKCISTERRTSSNPRPKTICLPESIQNMVLSKTRDRINDMYRKRVFQLKSVNNLKNIETLQSLNCGADSTSLVVKHIQNNENIMHSVMTEYFNSEELQSHIRNKSLTKSPAFKITHITPKKKKNENLIQHEELNLKETQKQLFYKNRVTIDDIEACENVPPKRPSLYQTRRSLDESDFYFAKFTFFLNWY